MSLAIAVEQPEPGSGSSDDTPQYTIGEVVARTGLTAHTLRWYERIGLLEHPARSHSGQRRFSDRDLSWLDFLGKLRLTAMPVADMVRYADLCREGDHTAAARQELLVQHRDEVRRRVADLQATLLIIDHKIDLYSDLCGDLHPERQQS